MAQLGKTLLIVGFLLVLVGGLALLAGKLGVGRLPGDVVIERKNVKLYLPIATSIVLSLLLTLLLNLFLRRR